MFVDCLGRELAVRGQVEAEDLLQREPGRWQVISIREPNHPESNLDGALTVHRCIFEDVQTEAGQHGHGPRSAHVESMVKAVDRQRPGPLLIHCWAGVSRSPAVALTLVVRGLWNQGLDGPMLTQQALETLRAIRPQAAPNPLVLRLGLQLFAPSSLVKPLSTALLRDPRILANRAGAGG